MKECEIKTEEELHEILKPYIEEFRKVSKELENHLEAHRRHG